MKSIKLSALRCFKSIGREQLKNIAAITLIFVLATTAGGLWLKHMPDFGLKDQAAAFDEIAQNLAEGRGFVWNNGNVADETPGYPYFLAVIYFIVGHNYTAVKVIQLLLVGLTSVFVYFTCKRLSTKFVLAVLAGAVTALWPYFLLYSNLILPEIFLTLLLITSVYLLLLFQKTPTYLKSAGLGVILGLAALTRPMVLLLPFFVTIGVLLSIQKFRKKRNFLKLLILLIAFIVTLAPWTVRNYSEFNELAPVKSEISKMDQGSSGASNPTLQEQTYPSSLLKNIYLFWNPGAAGKQAEVVTDKYPKAEHLILLYKIIFFCILALALASWRFLKETKILLIWLYIAYFWASYILVSPLPRYTLPVIPLSITLAGFVMNHLILWRGRKVK